MPIKFHQHDLSNKLSKDNNNRHVLKYSYGCSSVISTRDGIALTDMRVKLVLGSGTNKSRIPRTKVVGESSSQIAVYF